MWLYLKLLVIFVTGSSAPNNEEHKTFVILAPKEQGVITLSKILETYGLTPESCIAYTLRVHSINDVRVKKNDISDTGAYTQLLNGKPKEKYPITHEIRSYISLAEKENILLGNTGTESVTIELTFKELTKNTPLSVKQTA